MMDADSLLRCDVPIQYGRGQQGSSPWTAPTIRGESGVVGDLV